MAIRVHHATAKKAKKHGIELSVIENEVTASRSDVSLASAPSADRALAAALVKLDARATAAHAGYKIDEAKKSKKAWSKPVVEEVEDGDEGDEAEDAEDGDEDESRSVVKRKYRQAYRPTRNTCGDDLARLITEHVTIGKGKERRVDEEKLKQFARKNGCWDPLYENINVGLRRMSIGNRLRRKVIKEHHEIIW